MKKETYPDIHLVITVALKKELPIDRLREAGIPIHTLASLRSGALSSRRDEDKGMLIVITGAGLRASEEAAAWIAEHLSPFYVINIGTCGALNKRLPARSWVQPKTVSLKRGESIPLDQRLPIPFHEDIHFVSSLVSAGDPVTGDFHDLTNRHAIVDMECHAQASVFAGTQTSFHCIKFVTDYADSVTPSDFERSLEQFRERIAAIFHFVKGAELKDEVTVVIPVYNRQHTIRRAIDSVLAQTLHPAEIIVVDDCSDDRTAEILEEYGTSIRSISHSKNSGPSHARNAGAQQAGTRWIAFLDSDDAWEKDKLGNQATYLRKYPFYQIVQADEKWIRKGKRVNPCRHHAKPLGWIWEPSLERCLVSPSAVLLTKSLFEQFKGFDESLPVCEDYDLWLRISRHHPAGLDPLLSVVKYGGHEDQLSRKYPAMDRFRIQSLKAILDRETDRSCRTKIIAVMEQKLAILIKGYEKRGKTADARACNSIIQSLQ